MKKKKKDRCHFFFFVLVIPNKILEVKPTKVEQPGNVE
jgi:hypothetical protein